MELMASGVENNKKKNIVTHLEIVVTNLNDKLYYGVSYKLKGDEMYYCGYNSYSFDTVLNYIKEYFSIVNDEQNDKNKVYIDDVPEHVCCVCGKKFKMFSHMHYISSARLNLLSLLAFYDTYDCPYCGCQNRLLERYQSLKELQDVNINE